MILCKNCSAEFEGKFCPNCGQKAKTSRITFRQVFKEARDQLVHFDQGFLFTIKALTFRSGHTIREYLEGKRVKHIKPIRFMFWATAISFFVTHFLGFQERLMQQLQKEDELTQKSQQMGQKLMGIISDHPNLLMLCTIPTIALCAWVLFRKKKYNYAEYFTINTYLMGQLSVLSILFSLVFFTWGSFDLQLLSILGAVQWIIWALYFGWAYSQFFNQSQKVLAWIKGVLVLILGYTLMIIILSGLVAFIMSYFKPQVENWLMH